MDKFSFKLPKKWLTLIFFFFSIFSFVIDIDQSVFTSSLHIIKDFFRFWTLMYFQDIITIFRGQYYNAQAAPRPSGLVQLIYISVLCLICLNMLCVAAHYVLWNCKLSILFNGGASSCTLIMIWSFFCQVRFTSRGRNASCFWLHPCWARRTVKVKRAGETWSPVT